MNNKYVVGFNKVRHNNVLCLKNNIRKSPQHILKGWFDDDLPNILGINPLEAAAIFGVLYIVYGPTVLYDYAREAGKLFSQYGPMVQDISKGIFFEVRDYLEEDKEREILRKQGFDIDKIPRRTTNIFERVSESIKV